MPGQSILAKFKGAFAQKTAAPPPYAESQNPLSGGKTSGKRRGRGPTIKASDVPQWEWSTNECREWLTAFLVHKFNWSPADAAQTAEQFVGFGPTIYSTRRQGWKDLLGDDPGAAIYVWLLAVRHKEGAVPKSIVVDHGWADESTNKP